MRVSDFDFDLPADRIAQTPTAERQAARLLVLDRAAGGLQHHTVGALPALLTPGDLLVVNDTRVFPARLRGRRVPSGGAVECLLLSRRGDGCWEALMHPGQRLRAGARVVFERDGRRLRGEVLARRFHGRRTIRLWTGDGSAVDEAIDRVGHVPLPPYIRRGDTPVDAERYQTVYAAVRGSVAAPTAGLHLTTGLLQELRQRGVGVARVTLHVGYGTFAPDPGGAGRGASGGARAVPRAPGDRRGGRPRPRGRPAGDRGGDDHDANPSRARTGPGPGSCAPAKASAICICIPGSRFTSWAGC